MSFICFYGYKNKKVLEEEKKFKNLYEYINNIKNIKKEDIENITNILYDITAIEPETIGEFLKKPIKSKKVLQRYFEWYSHYYKKLPNDNILNQLIKIYDKYNYNVSNEVNDWLIKAEKETNNKNLNKKDIGCLNTSNKFFVKKFKKKKFEIYNKKEIEKMLNIIKTDYYISKRIQGYFFQTTIEYDIKKLNKILNLINQGWVITGN